MSACGVTPFPLRATPNQSNPDGIGLGRLVKRSSGSGVGREIPGSNHACYIRQSSIKQSSWGPQAAEARIVELHTWKGGHWHVHGVVLASCSAVSPPSVTPADPNERQGTAAAEAATAKGID